MVNGGRHVVSLSSFGGGLLAVRETSLLFGGAYGSVWWEGHDDLVVIWLWTGSRARDLVVSWWWAGSRARPLTVLVVIWWCEVGAAS